MNSPPITNLLTDLLGDLNDRLAVATRRHRLLLLGWGGRRLSRRVRSGEAHQALQFGVESFSRVIVPLVIAAGAGESRWPGGTTST